MKGLFLRRALNGYMPADKNTETYWRNGKLGEIVRAELVRPRSYRHHCLFMALLDLTFESQDKYTDDKMFRRAVALAAGHVEQIITLDGEPQLIPLSYSYDELPDEADFTKEFGKAMNVCAHLLHDIGLTELEGEVSRYADAKYGRAA